MKLLVASIWFLPNRTLRSYAPRAAAAMGPRVNPLSYTRRRRRSHETFQRADVPVRARRLPLLPVAVHPSRDQGADRRGARALRAAPARERAREDRRRGTHEFRRAPVQLSLREARAPPARGGADPADIWRIGLHAPVQDQRQAGLRRRCLAVAPGLRHLARR